MAGTWSIDPDVLLALRLEQIQQALRRGVPEQALAEAEEMLDEHPDHALGLFFAGRAALELGDASSAALALRRCAALQPGDPTILLALAMAIFETGDLDAALDAARQALDQAPQLARAWYYQGLALERLGRAAEAERCFAEAHRLDRDGHPLPQPVSERTWKRALQQALAGLTTPLQAFYLRVPIRWEEFPARAELRASFPPLSPLVGALYVGEPPAEGDPWHDLPEAVRLFRGNLRHPIPPTSSLEERISQALVQEALNWTGVAPEDVLPG